MRPLVDDVGVDGGAHLVYARMTGAFKRINLMTLGVQVDVFAECH